MPVPMIEPTRSPSKPAPAKFAWSHASSAAMSAKRVKRSLPLTSPSCASRGTSPPILQLRPAVSIDSMRRTPLRPARNASAAARLPRPKGETMPMPVMATRVMGIRDSGFVICDLGGGAQRESRIPESLREPLHNVDHVPKRLHGPRPIVRNRDVELLFDGEQDRQRVQRVDASLGERRRRGELLVGDVALLVTHDLDELPLDLVACHRAAMIPRCRGATGFSTRRGSRSVSCFFLHSAAPTTRRVRGGGC